MWLQRNLSRSAAIAALAALFFVGGLAAQPAPSIAALEKKVASASAVEKSAALAALSRALEAVDMNRAVEVARQARAAATKPHDELTTDARLATALRRRGDYVEAMTLARTGLGRATELNDDGARAELLLIFAQINGSIADYPAATEAYEQLAALAEKTGNRYMLARGHLGFSYILADTGEPKKARAEEEIVVRMAVELGDRELEADGLNNLGNNFRAAGEFDRAREAHERALALRTAAGNRRGMGDSLVNLGAVARSRGDLPGALDYTQRAFAVYEELGLKRYQANAHVQLAAILRANHQLDEALDHLNRALALAQTLNSHLLFADCQRELTLVFEAKGDTRAALDAHRRYTAENEAALGEKARDQIASLNARYNAERREQEAIRLRAANAAIEAEHRAATANVERARRSRLMLAGGLLVLLVIAVGGTTFLVRQRNAATRDRMANDEPPSTPLR